MEFKLYSIDEIGKVVGGGTPSTKNEEYYNGEISWITPKDLSGYNKIYISKGARNITELGLSKSSAKILPKESVLLTSRAPIGYVAIAGKELCTNQGFKSIICNTKYILPGYLYYYLKTSKSLLESIATGSTFKEVSGTILKNLQISIPDVKSQRKIINILFNIDKKIENNTEIISNLEKISQTLFKRWFIDFEFPNEDGKPYKSSGGEMVESELGEIPKGWEVKEFGDITEIQNGFAFRADDYISKGIRVIRTVNISKSNLTIDNETVYLPESYYHSNRYEKFKLKKFDTLLVMVGGSIGNTGILLSDNTPALQNQNQWRMRSKNINISSVLIYYFTNYINEQVSGWKSGSAREFYRKDTFNKYKIAIPKLETIESLDNILVANFEKIDLLHKQINILKESRDTLLPKLLSGEIEIPEDLEV